MRMVSPTADCCGGCWGSWTMCHDPTYVHKQPMRKDAPPGYAQQEWSETPWGNSEGSWRTSRKSPRRRTQSPRHRNANWRANSRRRQQPEDPPDLTGGKGQEKGKTQDKGGATAFGHLPPSTTWISPPVAPFSTEAAAPASASTTSSAMQPFGKPRQDKEDAELQALRHLHSQLRGHTGEQPEEVKKALAIVEAQTRKDDAKSYKQLIYMLTQARKKLSDIEDQWDTFRTQWSAYLDNATKMWTAHIDSYEEGETKFYEKRKEAAQYLQQVRAQLHDIHVRTMAVEGGTVPTGELQEGQTALDATMTIMDMDDATPQPQLDQLKTDLKGVVQKVKDTIEEKMHKRPLASRSGDGEDVQIVEPADKKQRDSNMP